MKLSKPGQSPKPVSYIDTIDDENVLKALEILRYRAMKVSKNNVDILPTNPSNKPANSTHSPDTLRQPSTPQKNSIHQSSAVGSSSTSPGVQKAQSRPSDPHLITTPKAGSGSSHKMSVHLNSSPILKSQPQHNEFIPKWKTNPRVDTEAMFPRWQRETYALERAVQEDARLSAEARALAQFETVQKESTYKIAMPSGATPIQKNSVTEPVLGLCPPLDGGTSKPSKTCSAPTQERTRSAAMAASSLRQEQMRRLNSSRPILSRQPTGGLFKRLANRLRGRTTLDDQGDDRSRASLEGTFADEDSRVALLLESICDFGCFNMVDEIFHPTGDEFTYATGAEDSITRASDDEGSMTGYLPTDDRTIEAGTGTQDSDELTQKGLFEFGPMITILEKFSAFSDGDKSDATQHQYMANLLEMMEDRLQEYGGYRRRRRGKGFADPQTISEQIKEVNGLILRIVEDFIDKQLMKVTSGDDTSFGSTRVTIDETTVADDKPETKYPRSPKSTTMCNNFPHSVKSPTKGDRNSTKDDTYPFSSGSPSHTLFPSRDMVRKEVNPDLSMKPRSESADGILNAPTTSPDRIIKDVKPTLNPTRRSLGRDERSNSRVATNEVRLDVNPAVSPKRRGRSNDGKLSTRGTDDDKSFISSKTGGSRGTLLMSNLTSVFSLSPKRIVRLSKSQGSESSINDWEGTRFVEADSGIPPRHPKVPVASPVRRMPFNMNGTNHQGSSYVTSRSGKEVSLSNTDHCKACAGALVDTSIDSSDGGSVGPFDDVSV